MSEADQDTRSFTSWKLGVMDAISIDPKITPSEFRVAFRLLQHAHSETKAIFPAQDTIAAAIGADRRTVRRCVKTLEQKGWIMKARANRQKSNRYSFSNAKTEAMDDRRTLLAERKKKHSDGTDLSPQANPERTDLSLPEGTIMSLPERTDLSPNNLKGTPEGNDLNNMALEQKDNNTSAEFEIEKGGADEGTAPALSSPSRATESINTTKRQPVILPDFDAMEIEIKERDEKRNQRNWGHHG